MRTCLFAFLLSLPMLWGFVRPGSGQAMGSEDFFTKADLRGGSPRHPSIEKIHKVFREHHWIGGLRDRSAYLRFEKRPEGWAVAVIEHPWSDGKRDVHRAPFWSAERREYQRVRLKGVQSGRTSQDLLERRSFNTAGFSHWSYKALPFYGYPNWEGDLIEELDKAHPLSDSLGYALGRAYSSLASELLEDTLPVPLFDEHIGFDKEEPVLDRDPMRRYYEYAHRSVALYDTVKARTPDFNAYIGSISIWRDHQVMKNFLELSYGRGLKEAKKELEKGLYSPFVRSMSKNKLRSCDSNAVLLTSADNHLYPLLYMQFQYGVRTDVKVIARFHLDLPSYVDANWKKKPSSIPLEFDIAKERISYVSGKGVNLKPPRDTLDDPHDPLPLDVWLDSLDRAMAREKGEDRITTSLPNRFELDIGGDTLIGIDSNSYLSVEDLMVIDILADREKSGRSIHCTSTFLNEDLFHLKDKMYSRASLYRFGPKEKEVELSELLGRNYRLYKELFEWDGAARIEGAEEWWLLQKQLYGLARTVKGLLYEGQKERARELLDLLTERVLQDSTVFALYGTDGILPIMSFYVSAAYRVDMLEKGDDLALKILDGSRKEKNIVSREHRDLVLRRLWAVSKKFDRQKIMERFRDSEIP